MNSASNSTKVTSILIEDIHILNPRIRSQKTFDDIIDNIADVGLKRPITVTHCHSNGSGKKFDLICGQGRVEAFSACGETEIPAIIIDANEEQALIMSLVENCARRKHSAMDLMQGIGILQKQGYEPKQISAKTGMSLDYVRSILNLMSRGEERLISAVEAGHIPITVAIQIAETADENMQQVLQDIYESKKLRGNRFLYTKKLIESRRRRGKAMLKDKSGSKSKGIVVSAEDVMKVYQREVDKKRLLARKAENTNTRLLFVIEAMKRLLREDYFNTLLRAEGLNTLPKPLANLLSERGHFHGP
jgi:ParB family chromosome partitioning protein